MSLVNVNTIDLVTILPGESRITLIIDDNVEIQNTIHREEALVKKLETYLKFVVSGQFARLYPGDTHRELCIKVVCLHPPSDGMKKAKGIRDHAHPETFLPVEIVSSKEFDDQIAKVKLR
jgi:hypothetical protein